MPQQFLLFKGENGGHGYRSPFSPGVDLHVHTLASDGTFTPTEAVLYARRVGLAAIAITDHDTMEGIAEGLAAGREAGLEVLPGLEFSTDFQGQEVHILGYLLDPQAPKLAAKLTILAQARRERAREMVARLGRLGLPLAWEQVEALARGGTIGRLHLARAMIAAGYVASRREAFHRYLHPGAPAYVPRTKIAPAEAVTLIKEAGGVPVLAHPGMLHQDELIPALLREGIEGIEVYHSEHSWREVARYRRLARERGLVETGGSDCHGPEGKDSLLMGTIFAPYNCVEALRRAATRSEPAATARAEV